MRDDVHETVSGSPDTAVVETFAPASDERAEAPTHVVVVFESRRETNVLWRDGAGLARGVLRHFCCSHVHAPMLQ